MDPSEWISNRQSGRKKHRWKNHFEEITKQRNQNIRNSFSHSFWFYCCVKSISIFSRRNFRCWIVIRFRTSHLSIDCMWAIYFIRPHYSLVEMYEELSVFFPSALRSNLLTWPRHEDTFLSCYFSIRIHKSATFNYRNRR